KARSGRPSRISSSAAANAPLPIEEEAGRALWLLEAMQRLLQHRTGHAGHGQRVQGAGRAPVQILQLAIPSETTAQGHLVSAAEKDAAVKADRRLRRRDGARHKA